MVESTQEKKQKTLPYLPHELIIQILMRLPVKSLIHFKCVCKLWFSLISDPHFANSHFQLTTTTHTPRIMCISSLSHEIRSIGFEAFLNDDDTASVNLNFSLPESYFPAEIRGSCRGFILLYRDPNIYIWNPSTGFKKQIPGSPFRSKLAKLCSIHIHGFGYDQVRDDYLVVVLSYHITVVSTRLKFFSFRDNTWKETEGAPFAYCVIPSRRKGFLFNGAIHWLALRRDLRWNVIVSFDLMERKLFEMPLPNNVHHSALVHSGLWVFGEYLSVWAKDNANDTVEIWVMKEYKVHSSWIKSLVLSVEAIPDHYFQPIYSTKNGDIIGRNMHSTNMSDVIGSNHGTRLVKYNYQGQLLRHHAFCNSPSEVVMYTESLLSLPGPGDNKQI
ncbi:F-box/kelch-repeat protein At3g23880 [Medicago truncatula]|uniref:Galactose oxidase n=2 Tax=Medicago truncatula TaxID=3880 RepID=G7JVS8_MEDTR|nr:F-box/kelch-repeat protein At3g23880 [Medicago truncatula]AES87230.2 galactose oxidase [Medicago truncatula]